jgi:predicted peroxiredoxin
MTLLPDRSLQVFAIKTFCFSGVGCKLPGNLGPGVNPKPEEDHNMERRALFTWLAGLPLFASGSVSEQQAPTSKKLKIMMKSAWGSDDPTRASFPFVHGLALADAGHDVQIFLVGEATYTMRKATVNAITPVGWPPLGETLEKVVAKHIPIFA